MYYAIYWRYHSLCTMEDTTAHGVISTLYYGESQCKLSAVGYYDSAANILYIDHFYWSRVMDSGAAKYSAALGLALDHTYADIMQISIDVLYGYYIS